ncbi:MAG: acyl-CoA dehydrogenase family protein [Oligoflexia bacterium]|nr:acyl-CoA dehydrogenase family protein [Oligoflexia bacterium]
MKPFSGCDFYQMDSLLSEDEKMIRDTIRDFISKEVIPIIEKHDREGTFPKQLIPKFAELGMLGATIKGYGCAGLSYTSYGLIMQELERGDSSLRSFVSVQGALSMGAIYMYGSEEQKEKYLPGMAQGKIIGCFGLTEPDFGSNPGGMITRAKKVGNEYILNGNKMWITSGGIADVAIVWAKTEDNVIRGFIVDKGTPGYTTTDTHGKFSLRASVTSELHFQDCKIPVKNLLPNVEGLKGPFGCLNNARFGIAWGAIGSMMAVFDEAKEYAKSRIQFDKPIASYQLVQAKLANMMTEITKAQLLALQLGRLKDQGKAKPYHVSMAKMNNVSEALKMTRMTRDILGANGITDEYQCGRHMRNLESVNTYEGTEDIHRLILGEYITGIAAYRVN